MEHAYIVIEGPGIERKVMELREGVTSFGRMPSNDVVLHGDLVSRQHSRITFFGGRATFQDQGSHNGSWVNGTKVQSQVIHDGDVCRVGNFTVRLHAGHPPQAELRFDDRTATETVPTALPASKSLLQRIEAAQAGPALEAQAVRILLRASEALNTAPNEATYLERLLALAQEHTRATHGVVVEGPTLHLLASRGGATFSEAVCRWVVSKKFPLRSDSLTRDLRFSNEPLDSAVIAAPLGGNTSGAFFLAKDTPFTEDELDVLSMIAQLAGGGIEGLRTRAEELTRAARINGLEHAHSPAIVAELASGQARFQRRSVALFAADIPQWGTLVERQDPAQSDAASFLEAFYFEAQKLVHQQKGILELSPPRLRATFGVPRSPGQDVARAAHAALNLRASTDLLLQRHPGIGARRLRAVLHTGDIWAGPLAAGKRLLYPILGEPAELVERWVTSVAPGAILVTEPAYALLRDGFELKPLGLQQIRGSQAMQTFELIRAH